MEAFSKLIKSVETKAETGLSKNAKQIADLEKSLQDAQLHNRVLMGKYDHQQTINVKQADVIKNIDAQNRELKKISDTLSSKLDEVAVGFEYIKMYGFHPTHFDTVMKAYKEHGKFPESSEVRANIPVPIRHDQPAKQETKEEPKPENKNKQEIKAALEAEKEEEKKNQERMQIQVTASQNMKIDVFDKL